MKKLLFLVSLLVAAVALAETDYVAREQYDRMLDGQKTFVSLTSSGNADIGGSLTVTGSGSIGGMLAFTPTALSVTNGQVITPTSSWMVLAPASGGTTNTIVYTGTGDVVLLTTLFSSASSVTVADDGAAMALGADIEILAGDVLAIGWETTTNASRLFSFTN